MTLAVPPEQIDALPRPGPAARGRGHGARRVHRRRLLPRDLRRRDGGLPRRWSSCTTATRTSTWRRAGRRRASTSRRGRRRTTSDATLLAMLRRLNLCSGEAKARHYDHEVKGLERRQAVRRRRATTCRPTPRSSWRATARRAASCCPRAINPFYSDIDTHAMADVGRGRGGAAPALRRRATRPHRAAGQLLLARSGRSPRQTPDGAYKLAQLVRACRGLLRRLPRLRHAADLRQGLDEERLDDGRGQDQRAADAAGLGDRADRRRARTPSRSSRKAAGDVVFLLGTTRDETGGSEYFRYLGERDGAHGADRAAAALRRATRCRGSTRPRRCRSTGPSEQAMRDGLVRSATTPARGGWAPALRPLRDGRRGWASTSTWAAAPTSPRCAPDVALFSESNGRFVVTIAAGGRRAVRARCSTAWPAGASGRVTGRPALRVRSGERAWLDLDVDDTEGRIQGDAGR